MSLLIAACCDSCGDVVASGRSAHAARRDLREGGGRAPAIGNTDVCGQCVKEQEAPGPLSAACERLAG